MFELIMLKEECRIIGNGILNLVLGNVFNVSGISIIMLVSKMVKRVFIIESLK